jgi:hypothetical protein
MSGFQSFQYPLTRLVNVDGRKGKALGSVEVETLVDLSSLWIVEA